MRAAVWHGRRDVRLEDVAEPDSPQGEDVLLEVCWTGICGTDLHEYLGGPIFIPPTLQRVVLGHEFSARVVDVGRDVTGVGVGDRVAVIPHRVCRACHFCRRGMYQHCRQLEVVGITRDGAFARYTIARQDQLVRLPSSVPDEVGALVEPLAVTLRAMQLPKARLGDTIAIIGAGPIGLCGVATARAAGLGDIFVVEKMPGRAQLAQKLGATQIIDPGQSDPVEAILELTEGRGVDVSLECVGLVATMNQAIEMARPDGLAVLLGIAEDGGDLELGRAVAGEKEIHGCIGYFEGEWQAVVDLLETGRLDPAPMITHRIEVDEIIEGGFRTLVEEKDRSAKVLVHP
jgi:(R,R)-butanediol dehydrogenase/meso-butanediol dehydrogenase/diacetyl reductase